jgi:hypothetical protein
MLSDLNSSVKCVKLFFDRIISLAVPAIFGIPPNYIITISNYIITIPNFIITISIYIITISNYIITICLITLFYFPNIYLITKCILSI